MSDLMSAVAFVAAIAALIVFTIKERKVVLREGPGALVLGVLLVGYAYFSYGTTERLQKLCSFEVVVPGYSALEALDFDTYFAQIHAGVPPDTTTVATLYETYPDYCR
jgi:hypothetical protein